MATIKAKEVTVTAAQAAEYVEAVCHEHGYNDNIQDAGGKSIPNPVTKVQFAQAQLDRFTKEWGHDIVIRYRRNKAVEAISNQTGLE